MFSRCGVAFWSLQTPRFQPGGGHLSQGSCGARSPGRVFGQATCIKCGAGNHAHPRTFPPARSVWGEQHSRVRVKDDTSALRRLTFPFFMKGGPFNLELEEYSFPHRNLGFSRNSCISWLNSDRIAQWNDYRCLKLDTCCYFRLTHFRVNPGRRGLPRKARAGGAGSPRAACAPAEVGGGVSPPAWLTADPRTTWGHLTCVFWSCTYSFSVFSL